MSLWIRPRWQLTAGLHQSIRTDTNTIPAYAGTHLQYRSSPKLNSTYVGLSLALMIGTNDLEGLLLAQRFPALPAFFPDDRKGLCLCWHSPACQWRHRWRTAWPWGGRYKGRAWEQTRRQGLYCIIQQGFPNLFGSIGIIFSLDEHLYCNLYFHSHHLIERVPKRFGLWPPK